MPNRLFLFNKKSIELLEKHGLMIEEYYIEPEIKKFHQIFLMKHIKSMLVDFFRITIPSILNKNNSITLIARLKNRMSSKIK